MIYQKPTCNCGQPLYMWHEEMYEVFEPITQTGSVSKRGVCKMFIETGAWDRLSCKSCRSEFDIEKDDRGRIIKGKVWEI